MLSRRSGFLPPEQHPFNELGLYAEAIDQRTVTDR